MPRPIVTFLCMADWAGSCYQVVKAINRIGRIGAHHIVLHQDKQGFEAGLRIPVVGTRRRFQDHPNFPKALQFMEEADLIHSWNNEAIDYSGIMPNGQPDPDPAFIGSFPVPVEKIKSYTYTGTDYRRRHTEINQRTKAERRRMIVQDPLFLFPDEIDATFIGHAIDVQKFTPIPIEERNLTQIACYVPKRSYYARDFELFSHIVSRVNKSFRFVTGNGMPHSEWLKTVAHSGYFFQNFTLGTYGRSTIEAAALGLPSFCKIDPRAKTALPDLAVIDLQPHSAETILKRVFAEDYCELSEKTRCWVEAEHSYEAVGEKYTKFFEELLNG